MKSYSAGGNVLREKVAVVCKFLLDLIREPIKAADAMKKLKDEGYLQWTCRVARSKLIQEGKLKVTRLGRGECYWHKPTVEPPPRAGDLAKKWLIEQLSQGAMWASDIAARAEEAGHSIFCLYLVREEAGVRFTRRKWFLEGMDPDEMSPPRAPKATAHPGPSPAGPAEPRTTDSQEPQERRRRRGRPKGYRDPDVAERKEQMLEAWDRGDFGTNKAAAGRAFKFHRQDATNIINAHEAEKCQN